MAWDIVFFMPVQGSVPGADFLDSCPPKVRGTILAVLDAVAAAPPPSFSGGGKWEAMHGNMGDYYEIRVTGPGREQFRLFCLLENADERTLSARGLRGPAIAVITGMKDVPQPVGQLPWGHVRCLLDKLDDPAARLWYARALP